ncbi:MAG: hypothetical protein S4CHLAM6_03680 [Chlamydiae bacterium]|nr:hypothetical protein [Chlamydiota bacterium]
MRYTIAVFGEAERGSFHNAFFCQSLEQLESHFGNPPNNSTGINCAIQALLYERNLIFFRVKEEGFSSEDYMHGLHQLEKQHLFSNIKAIGMPGVGDHKIIGASEAFCSIYNSILMTSEADFYDFLTDKSN